MPFSKVILPLPLPQSPKDCSIYLCLFCCLAYRVVVTIFLNSIYIQFHRPPECSGPPTPGQDLCANSGLRPGSWFSASLPTRLSSHNLLLVISVSSPFVSLMGHALASGPLHLLWPPLGFPGGAVVKKKKSHLPIQ